MNAAAVSPGHRVVSSDWRDALPVLAGEMVTLRELELGDAPSLLGAADDR